MDKKVTVFDGYLVNESEKLPVSLSHVSKFSLNVKFKNNYKPKKDDYFQKLVVEFKDSEFELSQCRLITAGKNPDFDGRLVFTSDIFDFDSLFFKKEIINLDTLSNNISLILSQKDKVKDFFKKYTADLIYDIKVYKQFLDTLDEKLTCEIKKVQKIVFDTIIRTEGKNFVTFFDAKLREMEQHIEGFTREEHEVHGFYLRKQLWDIIHCSEFMWRTNVKPRGYAGDSEMMRMIYENKYRGKTTFSKLLYKFSLDHPAAKAVRNRRSMISQLVRQAREESALEGGRLNFLSVACGPAWELEDIITAPEDTRNFSITLLDQDEEALNEARENIKALKNKIGKTIKATFLQDSVRTMLRTRDLTEKWGTFNFIYSLGLFDYLTPPVAKAVIEKIYSLLDPGGKLLIGNYHVNNPSRWFMEYWHDWVLFYRTEENFKSLLRDTDAENIDIIFEDSGSQMFLTAQKPG